ncbi:efflux RND transporter periplasmic adaptor subunit [uncultured Paraglaciecola sp.]|uniref:efflux RND transporter periplasmic adaptor subunit n=1 Tax=uncultured Paraglaciecola sp. TaxID=1765024 RepID=UPI0030D7BCC5|tara:strand:- start:223206 stop:224372 length:1167 start_codon:yes stop_codon:yes gene_type:complete
MTSTPQLPQQPSYKKYLVWLLPFIALVALILLMKASGSGQTQQAPTEVKKHLVNVMPIQWHQQYVQKYLIAGRAEAPQMAAIGFDLSGSVVNLLVDEGQQVIQGQILAELDTQRLMAQMTELSAIFNRANSDANLAKLSLKRVIELVDKNLESAQRLDETTESVNAANAFSDEILARKQSLQVEISKTKLRAPFDGSVVNRLVDKGAAVTAGQTIFTLQQNGQLEVRFALSADYANQLAIDQVVTVLSQSSPLLGKIKSIAQQRRLDTRTVDVIVSLTEPNRSILPGDLLNFAINSEVNSTGFWVPRKALVSSVRGLWSLFVVEAIDGELQLVAKLVELLHADDKKAFVRGALQDAELVVIEGVQRLVPGQKVLVAEGITTNSVAGLL